MSEEHDHLLCSNWSPLSLSTMALRRRRRRRRLTIYSLHSLCATLHHYDTLLAKKASSSSSSSSFLGNRGEDNFQGGTKSQHSTETVPGDHAMPIDNSPDANIRCWQARHSSGHRGKVHISRTTRTRRCVRRARHPYFPPALPPTKP